jgi:3D (Asp-Asp-Asp) domain-containing protein
MTPFRSSWRPKTTTPGRAYALEVTGYCSCQECCGWKRNWRGQPVFASGAHKGKPKPVGVTASGTRARYGTIAADTRLFPFGTLMYIPGYGYGRVEDCGQEIRGYELDLFFHSHSQALQWGRIRRVVRVWKPNEWRW